MSSNDKDTKKKKGLFGFRRKKNSKKKNDKGRKKGNSGSDPHRNGNQNPSSSDEIGNIASTSVPLHNNHNHNDNHNHNGNHIHHGTNQNHHHNLNNNSIITNGHNHGQLNQSIDYKTDQIVNGDMNASMQANTSGTSTDSNQSGNIKKPSPHNALQSAAGAMPIDSINTTTSAQDAIGELVNRMMRVLSKLKVTCHTNNSTHHSMDLERFQKLIEWVDYNESHLALLEQAWNDASFWPFLSTTEATERAKENKEVMLIRLSNTKPGAITVTRSAKTMKHNKLEDIVKHKRYFPSEQFGRITLEGSGWAREVTWDGLLAHLKQKECCICLEELKDNDAVLRLNCGHHFHRHCIEKHVTLSKRQNNTEFAVCPLCRRRINNAELIHEPVLASYRKIPEAHILNSNMKSKSFHQLNTLPMSTTTRSDSIQRAATAELTPTSPSFGKSGQDNVNDDNVEHMLKLMGQDNDNHDQGQQLNDNQQNNVNGVSQSHPWAAWGGNNNAGQFGNHLGVQNHGGFSDDDWEDEYGNVAQVRNTYNNQQHHDYGNNKHMHNKLIK
mmetsp:Transcript_20341/g.17975  ORF Transcript_20341/g.17975 Transcript_20341/m.17975 type:complete len:554 (+) Transcript_20341:163-1824(+)|eukprot:CAMPEP_0201579396 /NCGR_PEP_ID=MMETSP0190_2-20130828/26919_1 /ASSEMBLY_ACC=CAM_ASM_000263 /TAXON_ID=37353 /ORGANISM="Rosalina sp." /LENGTH=553 /DNA_ID=CAMNT_0048013769 /DNA_START=163 /DNA_END=1824 /DNA_ORIENTATION=+